MFFIRFAALLFLVAYGLSLGKLPDHELNAFGKLAALSTLVTAPMLYLLPTFEAWKRQHPNLSSVGLMNVFLGWTVLGWVAALVWAFKKAEPVRIEDPTPPPVMRSPVSPSARATKRCPFCAEDVLAEAVKCKHCGSDLQARS